MTPDPSRAEAEASAVAASAARLRQRLGALQPRIAVVLGSGWGGLAGKVDGAIDVPYDELPAFPRLAVGGHAGLVRAGTLSGTPVLVLAGRKHAYETGDVGAMRGVVRTLAALGVTTLVQTNAAGSLDRGMPAGSLMLITDHLNLVQRSPLVDDPGVGGDKRFVDMANAYDPTLAEQARTAARKAGQTLHEGIYVWLLGPQFETPAEIRMLQGLGGHAVGMSTVPETILARHAGLKVLAFSLFTNMAAGLSDESLSHAHTMATAASASERACNLLAAVIPALSA
ncbi:MAG: purine-nucleoside phosphorylase [Rubrivivax sp.]|jgi:purine-nucleoside phosphorylase|nr:purine-nucleoside phosphorylase [Rubrivivax sp.]